MTRSRIVATVALAVVLAGCGVDAAQVASGSTTAPGTTAPAVTQPATTTTVDEPRFTLPSIPPGETGTTQAPRNTATTAPTTLPAGGAKRTPAGLTEAQFAGILHDQAALSVSVAECTAKHTFAEIAPKDIDTIFSADDESQLDPALALQFTSIITLCIQGG